MKGLLTQVILGAALSRLDAITEDSHDALRDAAERRIEMAKKRAKKAHPGFKSVQNKIANKQGVSKKAAGAILAASTRKASSAAKKRNPRLKRVK